jgi:hypothetical protein
VGSATADACPGIFKGLSSALLGISCIRAMITLVIDSTATINPLAAVVKLDRRLPRRFPRLLCMRGCQDIKRADEGPPPSSNQSISPCIVASPAMCDRWTQDRRQCHALYGKQGEDCLREELAEKRCLSHHHCPIEASRYYGPQPHPPVSAAIEESAHGVGVSVGVGVFDKKALCASWAESFAFRDDMEQGEHHARAAQLVNASKERQIECRQMAMNLAQCLRQNYRYRG